MTKAIYPYDEEEWIGIDQNTDEIDNNLYKMLMGFLEEYFCSENFE